MERIRKRILISFAALALIFILAGGSLRIFSDRNVPGAGRKEEREAHPGKGAVTGEAVSAGAVVQMPIPAEREPDPALTTAPDQKRKVPMKPQSTPKKKRKKKATPKPAGSRPPKTSYSHTPEPVKPRPARQPKPPEEVISGNGGDRGEENITGVK